MRLIFDGAFGTYYSSLYKEDENCEWASIKHRERVLSVHREYIEAGADAIKTNTFGVGAFSCDENTKKEIISKAYETALEAAGDSVRVFADIGYIDDDKAEEKYTDTAKIFADLGAKDFLFETLAEFDPILPALKFIRENVKDATVIVSFAVDQNGWTRKGLYYKILIGEALKNADYAGLNCINGPHHICKLIKNTDNFSEIKHRLSAMPNTSNPSMEHGRFFVYPDNKEYYAERLAELWAMGLGCVGGCCGSTPEHIKLFAEKINYLTEKKLFLSDSKFLPVKYANTDGKAISEKDVHSDIKTEEKFGFEQMLKKGKKVIAAEMDSPLDTDMGFMLEGCRKLRDAGCDIITIADSPLARARADSFICGAKIRRELGIEVLPHLSCRDRNQIAIKGALLGANIENISSVLAVTGDPVSGSEAKGTFAYSSFTLIDYINNLNSQVFEKNPFFICGALNIHSPNFETELKRAEKKQEKGCRCFLTQPVYTKEDTDKLKKAKDTLSAYILGGVMPIVSYRNAVFLNNEVFGINIPDSITERFKDKDRETSEKIGLETAFDICGKIKDFCDGLYIMVPLRRVDMTSELISEIRKNYI